MMETRGRKNKIAGKIISSVDQYLAEMRKLPESSYIYRGQADEQWHLRSGATRRIFRDLDNEDINYDKVAESVKKLLTRAKNKGFGRIKGKKENDLELLAELQHHGAATPLLDFTRNSLVALWMACSDCIDRDGRVFVANINDSDCFEKIEYEDLAKEIDEFFGNAKAFFWNPASINERIPAQSSIFIFAEEPYEFATDQLIIAAKAKKSILKELEQLFDVTEETIFPDFTGFAQANSADKLLIEYEDFYYFNKAFELFKMEEKNYL